MSETKEVTARQGQDVAQQTGGQGLARGDFVLPRVDIYEDENGIVLLADLPGVANDRLNLQVDRNTLLIEAEATVDAPQPMKALYAEVRNPRYRRGFALGSELDTAAVQANLKDGVLTLRLPKKAEHQPRKITVQTT